MTNVIRRHNNMLFVESEQIIAKVSQLEKQLQYVRDYEKQSMDKFYIEFAKISSEILKVWGTTFLNSNIIKEEIDFKYIKIEGSMYKNSGLQVVLDNIYKFSTGRVVAHPRTMYETANLLLTSMSNQAKYMREMHMELDDIAKRMYIDLESGKTKTDHIRELYMILDKHYNKRYGTFSLISQVKGVDLQQIRIELKNALQHLDRRYGYNALTIKEARIKLIEFVKNKQLTTGMTIYDSMKLCAYR